MDLINIFLFFHLEHKGSGEPVAKKEQESDTGFFQLASKVLKKISVAGDSAGSRLVTGEVTRAGPLQPLQLLVS